MARVVPPWVITVWKRGMQLGVTSKLVLAFILTNGTVVVFMVVFMHWSFGRGFLGYLHQTEVRHLDAIVEALEQAYTAYGNWQFLRHNPRRWYQLLRDVHVRGVPDMTLRGPRDRLMPPRDEMPEVLQDAPPHRPPPLPDDVFLLGPRLGVLDAEKQLVVGGRRERPNATLRPIMQGEHVVGWLRLTPLQAVTDELDRRFLAQQSRTFSLVAVAAIALAVGVSVCLARHFLAPVKDLTQGTRALIAGQFATRIGVASGDELGQLARDFNILAHTLEKNEQARRQLTADIAHELRIPLTILRGEIEAIEDGVRTCNAAAIQSLHAEVLTLSSLVEDLYELSLSDLGALTYRKAPLDLAEVLDTALTAFGDRFTERHLTVEAPPRQGAPIWVFADAERLSQLCTNLFENTLRYTDPGGRLRVWYERHEHTVAMHVQDSAPGVPEEALPKLFDRFYRVEMSRNRAHGGTGLGLAICKNIVEAHEGKISAQPSPLGGLWIQIILPLYA